MLCVNSPHEVVLSKAAQGRLWANFKKNGTNHSGRASLLPYIIRRCELEGVPYVLKAYPGRGYYISMYKEESA
jgi:hypothetical protein